MALLVGVGEAQKIAATRSAKEAASAFAEGGKQVCRCVNSDSILTGPKLDSPVAAELGSFKLDVGTQFPALEEQQVEHQGKTYTSVHSERGWVSMHNAAGEPILESGIALTCSANGVQLADKTFGIVSDMDVALAATVVARTHAIDERSVGDFDSFGDQLETLCLITLLVTFVLGPVEGGALSVLISVLAIGAWHLNKQEEAAKRDDGAERE